MVVADKAVDNTTVSLSWIPSSARLCAVGSDKRGKGCITIYALNGREIVKTETSTVATPFRSGSLETGDLSDRILAAGDYSGQLSIWDLETLKSESCVKAHSDVLNCVAGVSSGRSHIVTGGRDGEVKLWDRRSLDVPVLRMLPQAGQTRRECWSVSATQHNLQIIAAAFDNGDIKIFDVRNSKIAWETSLNRGVSSLKAHSCKSSGVLMAGSLEGKLYKWCIETPDKNLQQLQCQDMSTVWATDVMQSGDKSLILASFGTGALSLIDEGSLQPVLTDQISNSAINCLSVCTDKPGLLALSGFDKFIRVLYYTGIK